MTLHEQPVALNRAILAAGANMANSYPTGKTFMPAEGVALNIFHSRNIHNLKPYCDISTAIHADTALLRLFFIN